MYVLMKLDLQKKMKYLQKIIIQFNSGYSLLAHVLIDHT